MADETLPGTGERRRPAPTIDLKATEISSGPGTGSRQTAPPAGPPAADQDTAEDAAPTPPRSAVHSALAGLAAAVSWPMIGAGVAGALLTLGVAWIVLALTDRGSELAAAEARIAQLERQAAGVASANSAASGDLAARLQRLEAQAAAPRAPARDEALANRIATLEGELRSLADGAAALSQRNDGAAAANAAALRDLNEKIARSGAAEAQSSAASSEATNANAAQIAALAGRLDALEGGARKLEEGVKTALAARDAEMADERALRTALVAAALAAAVERGAPFAGELAAARELAAAQKQAPDPQALAPLAPFAAGGIGDAAALTRELAGLEPALRQAAAAPPPDAGFLAKLSANAQRLVRVSPLDEAPGDDLATVITRIEVKAARGDLSGALAELAKLPPAVRAPADEWIAKAQARQAALDAGRAFAGQALADVVKR
jgi:hypothetical protein